MAILVPGFFFFGLRDLGVEEGFEIWEGGGTGLPAIDLALNHLIPAIKCFPATAPSGGCGGCSEGSPPHLGLGVRKKIEPRSHRPASTAAAMVQEAPCNIIRVS